MVRDGGADTAALVTGASSGIGAALAVELARRGADVALVARRRARLEDVAAQVEGLGRRALVLPADVTAPGEVEAAVEAARTGLGRLDVVVANAGFAVRGTVASLTLDDYRRQMETNVFGVLRVVKAALPEVTRRRGRLVLMGSVSSYASMPTGSAYAMSKFALRALADALRYEVAGAGVTVTLVCPGFVESEIYEVDNLGQHQPGRPRGVPAWLVMPTARAARQIATAVERRRAEIVVTGHGRLAVALERHAPRLLHAAVGRLWTRGRLRRGT